jgi:hypothetical protein
MAKKIERALWRDRLRHFGLPVSFVVYEVTEERLIVRKGFFRTETNEVLLYRITDTKLVRTLGQKIFGVGTVTLYSSDRTDSIFELKNIARSGEVREFISDLVEQQRNKRGLLAREFINPHGYDDEDDDPTD